MPWLNRVDGQLLEETVGAYERLCVVNDHSVYGELEECLLNAAPASLLLGHKRVVDFGIGDFPECDTPQEALAFHK